MTPPKKSPRDADAAARFPDRFVWGAATSAYQIEGSPLADGAGPSIWHRFVHTPGTVHDGDTGDIACDHYRRAAGDVALMAALGLTAYRFSVAWSRVLPAGRGRVNARGLAFYDRLVDTLLASNIQPHVTLYHWDLPAALDDRGGWLNPDCAGWFADYADVVVRALDDRVPWWTTLNEPWVVADGGYLHGVLAPGHRNRYEAPRVTHHLLRAHAAAVSAYRSRGRHQIGLVVNLEPQHPASSREADRLAAAQADAYMNRQYLDPVFRGTYPDEVRERFGDAWPESADAEAESIRQPLDFLGVNYYTRSVVRAGAGAAGSLSARGPLGGAGAGPRVRQRGRPHTAMGWEVYPAGLTETLRWVRDRYGDVPLFVTENGAAFPDPPVSARGRVDDRPRVAYLRAHLRATLAALRAGVDVRGYFAWSLLDNFEWAHGFGKRFGLVHVDYTTQRRTPKASAHAYARIIASRGAALGGPASGPATAGAGGAPAARRRPRVTPSRHRR